MQEYPDITERDQQLQRNNRDYNHELSGVDTGRQKRFIPESATPAAQDRQREERDFRRFALHQLTLEQQAQFQRLYDETVDLARRAALLTSTAIEQLEHLLMNQHTQREDMLARATRLHDGRLVFQDENGKARFEDGTYVSAADAATIVWRDGSPTYEEQRGNAEAIAQTQEKLGVYRDYETRVGEIQHQLDTHKNDLTVDDVKRMQRDLIDGAPVDMQTKLDPSDVTSYESSHDTLRPTQPVM